MDMTPHPGYLAVRFGGFRLVDRVDAALAAVDAELRRLALDRVLLDTRALIGVLTEYDRGRSIDMLVQRLGWARCALLIDSGLFTGVQHARLQALGLQVRVFFAEAAAVRWLAGDWPAAAAS